MCRRKMDENKVNEVKLYLQHFIKLSNMTWKSHNSSNINSNNVGFNVKFDCLGENCDDMLVITIELHMLLCIMIEICSILIHEICNLCCIVILFKITHCWESGLLQRRDFHVSVWYSYRECLRKIHVYSSHLDDYFNPTILCVALIYFVVILLQ